MKIANTILIYLITLILNILFFTSYLLSINSLIDILIISLYIVSTITIFFFIYLTSKDIIRLHILKNVLSKEPLLNSISTITTNLIFKFRNNSINDLLSNVEEKYIIKILLHYLPLNKLLIDPSLIIVMDNNDKTTYTTILKNKLIDIVNTLEPPYKKVYILIAINISSLLLFLFLL